MSSSNSIGGPSTSADVQAIGFISDVVSDQAQQIARIAPNVVPFTAKVVSTTTSVIGVGRYASITMLKWACLLYLLPQTRLRKTSWGVLRPYWQCRNLADSIATHALVIAGSGRKVAREKCGRSGRYHGRRRISTARNVARNFMADRYPKTRGSELNAASL